MREQPEFYLARVCREEVQALVWYHQFTDQPFAVIPEGFSLGLWLHDLLDVHIAAAVPPGHCTHLPAQGIEVEHKLVSYAVLGV